MPFLGLDIISVAALSRQLSSQADELTQATVELNSFVGEASWSGPDRERFVNRWQNEARSLLLRSENLLRDASQLALHEARRQDQASREG